MTRFVRVLEHCQSLRRLGSCALNMCYVAAGRLDAYWATNVAAWDSAAGTVIAREAGAVLTAYDGSPLDDWNPKFCVSASDAAPPIDGFAALGLRRRRMPIVDIGQFRCSWTRMSFPLAISIPGWSG